MKLQTEIPDRLYHETMLLVRESWFHDENQILNEALRRFVDSHRTALIPVGELGASPLGSVDDRGGAATGLRSLIVAQRGGARDDKSGHSN